MTGSSKYDLAIRSAPPAHDHTAQAYFSHSSARRVNTDIVIVESLRRQYPELQLTIAPQGSCDLLAYAAAGHATATPSDTTNDPIFAPLKWRTYVPPAKRLDGPAGFLVNMVMFAKYMYVWNSREYIVYIVDGRDGTMSYPEIVNHYILSSTEQAADELILASSQWGTQLHNEVWVYDQGFWQKSAELWQSVQQSEWENVILDPEMKNALIADVNNFFDSRDTYAKLRVPWKRGIIYYGPPGNGKTISIKAMMHSLYRRKEPVPTLYVRSLMSWSGPENAISEIFMMARQEAPCYLVLEDLDSIITDDVRSYFLNEVDGLKNNDGILIVGSTNHLDQLDPGIAKRPSRFDRKYFFSDPNFTQRVAYAKFWQRKLSDNPDIEFPDRLCTAVARITDKFSFAYMQEAFVASLLAIAARGGEGRDQEADVRQIYDVTMDEVWRDVVRALGKKDGSGDDDDEDLDGLILWKEIKKQVKILREEMDLEKVG